MVECMLQCSCLYYIKTFDLSFSICTPNPSQISCIIIEIKHSGDAWSGISIKVSICLGGAPSFIPKGQHDHLFTNKQKNPSNSVSDPW